MAGHDVAVIHQDGPRRGRRRAHSAHHRRLVVDDDLALRRLVAAETFAGVLVERHVVEVTGEADLQVGQREMTLPGRVVAVARRTVQVRQLQQPRPPMLEPHQLVGVGLVGRDSQLLEDGPQVRRAVYDRRDRHCDFVQARVRVRTGLLQPRPHRAELRVVLRLFVANVEVLLVHKLHRRDALDLDLLGADQAFFLAGLANQQRRGHEGPVAVTRPGEATCVVDVGAWAGGAVAPAEVAGDLGQAAKLGVDGVLLAGGVVTVHAAGAQLGRVQVAAPGLVVGPHDVALAAERRPRRVVLRPDEPAAGQDDQNQRREADKSQPPPARRGAARHGRRGRVGGRRGVGRRHRRMNWFRVGCGHVATLARAIAKNARRSART